MKNRCIFLRAGQCIFLFVIFGVTVLHAGHFPQNDPATPIVPAGPRNLGRQRVVAASPVPELPAPAPDLNRLARFMGRIDRPGNRNNPNAERKG